MNKADIKKIITIIKSDPNLALALREALLSGEEAAQNPQLSSKTLGLASAGEVASMIHKSSAWVRQNLEIWPSAFKEKGQKGKWWFDRAEVIPCYNIYIRSKSL